MTLAALERLGEAGPLFALAIVLSMGQLAPRLLLPVGPDGWVARRAFNHSLEEE